MAAITIERGLNQQSSTLTAPLIGFRYQQGIQFVFNHGGIVGSYAEVAINGRDFKCVKIATVSVNEDRYQIDLSEVVQATKTIAPNSVIVAGLLDTMIYTVNGKNSAKATIASSAPQTVYISFAKPFLKSGLYYLYTNGFSRGIYHNGKYCQFVSATTAYAITTANTNDSTHFYSAGFGEEIAWINRDGAWAFWNFRKITETLETKKSTEVVNYALSNFELTHKTYDIDTEAKLLISFDTIAVDSYHYRQLTEIGLSERVIYDGKCWGVKDWVKVSAEVKQNLKFTLTLEIEENG